MPRLKVSNKYPKEKFIFNALSAWDDVVDNLLIEVEDEEENLTASLINVSQLEYILTEYHKWAAKELATNGILRRQDVYNKIDELT